MVSVARKNLFHDRGRLAITLIGIAASVLLILFSMGMFYGTINEAVYIIDNNPEVKVWVVQDNAKSVTGSSMVTEDSVKEIEKIDGVKKVHSLIYMQGIVEEDGVQVLSMITGFKPEDEVGGPWELTKGRIKDLKKENAVIYDKSFEKKFKDVEAPEINGIDLNVVGESKGAKWFTFPYLFTSLENARKVMRLRPEQSNFFMIETESGETPEKIAKEISKIEGVDALTTKEIRKNSQEWMIFESGMGVGIGTMAIVGLFVAAIIVSLTVYTATMERLPEFGTLKAIGADRSELSKILLEQVVLGVTLGYFLGVIFAFGVGYLVNSYTLMPVFITPLVIFSAYLATLILSIMGAFFSMRRVNKVDPAIVFRA